VPEDLALRPAFSELDQTWGQVKMPPRPMVAIVNGRHRMIQWLHDGRVELYDRAVDPLEQTNLAEREPAVVEALRGEISTFAEKTAPWDAPQVELDEMRRLQLQALGYVDRK
jgi:hypothetical protein